MHKTYFPASLFASVLLAAPPILAQQGKPSHVVEKYPKAPKWLKGYNVRWPVRVAGDFSRMGEVITKSVMVPIPTGGWLSPDASDIVVQTANGKLLSPQIRSHDPIGNTIVQFQRNGEDRWYWVYGARNASASANPTTETNPFQEGLILEVREWVGEELDSWAHVVDGLKKSETVIGNAIAPEIIQYSNPFRPADPRNFCSSYRGHLRITKPGTYQVLGNGDGAVFLFIDGYKVYERPGSLNQILTGLPRNNYGTAIEFDAGIHEIEMYQVITDSPLTKGKAFLAWIRPGNPYWEIVNRGDFAPATHAIAAPPEMADGKQGASFVFGIDEVLMSSGLTLFLVRFEAVGNIDNPNDLVWDMGDGTTRRGRSFRHVYMEERDYMVSLKSSPRLPEFTQRVYAWPIWNTATSPFVISWITEALEATEWQKYDVPTLYMIYQFLESAGGQEAWNLLERVCELLLTKESDDETARGTVYQTLINTIAELGRPEEAVQRGEEALKEFAGTGKAEVGLHIGLGDILFRHLKDPEAATSRYRKIIEEFRSLSSPEVRLAAVRLGDVSYELGDIGGAGDAYRMAGELGGLQYQRSAVMDAATHGAQLRIVEQRLRAGDIDECRALLRNMELEAPEQKLKGQYQMLKAEVDRAGGRYEQAIAAYERVLGQLQWAGMHDRVLFGMADANLRMGELGKALEIVGRIKQVYPKYFEAEELAEYEQAITDRLMLSHTSGGSRKNSYDAGSGAYHTGFEPSDARIWEIPAKWYHRTTRVTWRSQGIIGPHVLLAENVPPFVPGGEHFTDWILPVRNLEPHGYFWVEYWYRDREVSHRFTGSQVYINVQDRHGKDTEGPNYTLRFWPTFDRWRKYGALRQAPLASEGRIFMSVRYYGPTTSEIDGIRIMPVTDRQFDVLRSFIVRREEVGQ
jgi:tetratricopeptide (TPR) repeat protein